MDEHTCGDCEHCCLDYICMGHYCDLDGLEVELDFDTCEGFEERW